MRGIVFVAGLALVAYQAWSYHKRTQNRIFQLEGEVSRQTHPAPATPAPKPTVEITDLQERILDTIAHSKFNTAELLARQLQIGPNITEQQLERLENAGLIWMEDTQYGVPGQCGVMPAGRDYLIERGLLK